MFLTKSLIGSPVRPLRFGPVNAFQHAAGPAHFCGYDLPANRHNPRLFALRRIGQPVAMAAREGCIAVEASNAATAPRDRAEGPIPFIADTASKYSIPFDRPSAIMILLVVVQDHTA